MQILTRTNHLTLSPAQQEYLEKKINKLTRYAERVSDSASKFHIDVTNQQVKSDQKIEIKSQVHLPHDNFHVEVHATSFESAVDELFEKLERHIGKYKEKF